MDKRIIYTGANGGCDVLIPSGQCVKELMDATKGLSETDALNMIAGKDVPEGVPYQIVPSADLPGDRLFRKAWVLEGKAVTTDLTLAKEIAHGRRRAKRSRDFAPRDHVIATQVPGSPQTEAEEARRGIRDADATTQKDINGAKSETALRGIMAGTGLLD